MNVKVTNRNQGLLKDKFGGVEYKFPPNETVLIPDEAAEHIFGYGLSDKERFKKMMRMGLANHKDGKRIWDNFLIKPSGNVVPTGAARESA